MGGDGRISLRFSTGAERVALARLSTECFGAAAWRENDFGGGDGRAIVLAERGRQLIGYAVVQCIADQAELQSMAVTPGARRHGVGGRLLAAAIAAARARGAVTMFLEVRESNAAARTFYAQAGFSGYGRRERYYRDPVEAALLMRLALD